MYKEVHDAILTVGDCRFNCILLPTVVFYRCIYYRLSAIQFWINIKEIQPITSKTMANIMSGLWSGQCPGMVWRGLRWPGSENDLPDPYLIPGCLACLMCLVPGLPDTTRHYVLFLISIKPPRILIGSPSLAMFILGSRGRWLGFIFLICMTSALYSTDPTRIASVLSTLNRAPDATQCWYTRRWGTK